jgi:hypothetical protein
MEPASQQRFQAVLPEAQKFAGQLRIEEILDLKPKVPVQGTNIIIRPVEYFADPRIGENGV